MDFSDMSSLVETIVIPWGIRIALALVIFYAGRLVVGIVTRSVQKLVMLIIFRPFTKGNFVEAGGARGESPGDGFATHDKYFTLAAPLLVL